MKQLQVLHKVVFKNNYFFYVTVLLITLLLASCKQQHVSCVRASSCVTGKSRSVVQAQYLDLAFPITCKSIDRSCLCVGRAARDVLSFTVQKMTMDNLVDWYQREMERLGWDIVDVSDPCKESVLVCSKPSKLCVITVQQHFSSLSVRLFVSRTKSSS